MQWLPQPILSILTKVGLYKPKEVVAANTPQTEELCCDGRVQIFYRGVSDDRLYKAEDRHWREVKFFRPNGLKVFCKQCRRSLL